MVRGGDFLLLPEDLVNVCFLYWVHDSAISSKLPRSQAAESDRTTQTTGKAMKHPELWQQQRSFALSKALGNSKVCKGVWFMCDTGTLYWRWLIKNKEETNLAIDLVFLCYWSRFVVQYGICAWYSAWIRKLTWFCRYTKIIWAHKLLKWFTDNRFPCNFDKVN